MRHGNKINNLGRKKAHRKALLSNLSSQLIVHKRLVTTLAKAKALRSHIEPIITKAKNVESKESTMHEHRIVFSYLQNKEAVKELFTVVGPRILSRPGGYTRIIKLGIRSGDNAEKALIELVDFNEIYNTNSATSTEGNVKKTRRGRSKKVESNTTTEEADIIAEVEDVTPEAEA